MQGVTVTHGLPLWFQTVQPFVEASTGGGEECLLFLVLYAAVILRHRVTNKAAWFLVDDLE